MSTSASSIDRRLLRCGITEVLITPHISGGAEERSTRPIDLFIDNLAALRRREPLRNVVDWGRGY